MSYTALGAVNPGDVLNSTNWGNRSRDNQAYLKEHEVPTGAILPFCGHTPQAGYLLCDGSLISTTVYADLFAALVKTATITMTVASPGVITWAAHAFPANTPIKFATSGALPTGIVAGVTYYIKTVLTSSTFTISATPGGSVINTTGSQSGTHTGIFAPYGYVAAATTFNLPDLRSKAVIGAGTGAIAVSFGTADVNTGTNVITVPSNESLHTGLAFVLSTTSAAPGGLSAGTTYYIIRLTATTISLATSRANALAGTAIDITTTGTGTHTLTETLTTRAIGDQGGVESKSLVAAELGAHTHNVGAHTHTVATSNSAGSNFAQVSGGGGSNDGTHETSSAGGTSGSAGGDTAFSIMPPFLALNWIIKT